MKIFIDSAKLEEIEEGYKAGIIDGVTTNPSLIKKAIESLKEQGEPNNMATYIKKILTTAKGNPVSLEVTDFTYRLMVEQGKKLYEMFNPDAGNVYIKIPISPSFEKDEGKEYDGIKAIAELSEAGIPVNCTLIFTPEQALLAAKAGAKIVSPFAGRVDDFIRSQSNITYKKTDYFPQEGRLKDGYVLEDNGIVSGIDLVWQIVEVFKEYDIEALVLAASIRNARQTREAALAGADIATLPYAVIKELIGHYKTREGMKKFAEDTIPEYAGLTKIGN